MQIEVHYDCDRIDNWRFYLDRVEFHEIMAEFKRRAEAKEFERIDYNTWRMLWKWDYDIDIEFHNYENSNIYLLDAENDTVIERFHGKDNSFGSFLAEYKERKLKEKMEENNKDSISVDGLNATSSYCNGYSIADNTSYTFSPNTTAIGTTTWSDPIATKGDVEISISCKADEIRAEIEELRQSVKQIVEEAANLTNDVNNIYDTKVNICDHQWALDEIYRYGDRINDLERRLREDYLQSYAFDGVKEELYRLRDEVAYFVSDYQYALADVANQAEAAVNEKIFQALKDYEDSKNPFRKPGTTSNPFVDVTTNNINNKENKENEKMKNFVNFDFGPCTGDNVRMSMYGLAVKNISGTWVSYDAANHAIMDVDVFNFEGSKFLYKMPVAIKDIKVGSIIIHARKPMFVTAIATDRKTLTVVDPVEGEEKTIMVSRSPFNFDFCTCVVNLLGNMSGATSDCPFGNMWMFMLMNDSSNMEDILPLMILSNAGNANMTNGFNPMMLMLMGDKGESKDWLLPMMLMGNMNVAVSSTNQ